MKILAKIVKTSAAIAALSAIAAIITGIIFESVKLTSYFLGIFIALSLINLNIYIILGILGKDTKDYIIILLFLMQPSAGDKPDRMQSQRSYYSLLCTNRL